MTRFKVYVTETKVYEIDLWNYSEEKEAENGAETILAKNRGEIEPQYQKVISKAVKVYDP